MTFTKEQLIKKAQEQIAFCRHTKITGEGLAHVNQCAALFEIALAALDSEPVAYIDKQWTLVYYVPPMSMGLKIGDKLYRHAQPAPVVDSDDNFYSWFGREWHENYQHNQYTTAAKQMLGVMAESAWRAGRRAAMLQAGNSPVIPDGSEDTKRLNWLDAQNKRLNEYYGTSYGWKFDANFQRNAMMLNDSNYPVMTVRQAIDEAISAAPQEPKP